MLVTVPLYTAKVCTIASGNPTCDTVSGCMHGFGHAERSEASVTKAPYNHGFCASHHNDNTLLFIRIAYDALLLQNNEQNA